MPLEPKKPIDELLETSAKARRAAFGADPKMPNPMRTQLHHEISRLARKDECESRWRAFGLSWPRLVTATALALLLVSASAIWWRREHQSAGGETRKLALQQPMPPEDKAAAPQKVFEQGAAAPTVPAFADGNATASRPAEQAKDADTPTKSAGTTTAPSPTGPVTEDLMAAGAKADQPLLAGRSLAAKETNQSTPAAASLAQNRQTTNFRQQFSENASDQAFRSKPKQTLILNEFQVEQTDHEIRVVDGDGSTYSGRLEPLAKNDARSIFNQKRNYAAPSSRASASFDDKAQAANAEFYFRATGYNSSLKKRVVFEGNYIASSAAAQKKAAEAKAEAEERDEQTRARITGTAKIPGESSLQIDAIAVAK